MKNKPEIKKSIANIITEKPIEPKTNSNNNIININEKENKNGHKINNDKLNLQNENTHRSVAMPIVNESNFLIIF
jgi:hypothetical protein